MHALEVFQYLHEPWVKDHPCLVMETGQVGPKTTRIKTTRTTLWTTRMWRLTAAIVSIYKVYYA